MAGVFTEGEFSVLARIENHARLSPTSNALIFEDRRYTYAEFVAAYHRIGAYFEQLNLGGESRICILAKNCPEYFFVYFATLYRGGTLFPINHELSESEISYIVEQAAPDLIVVGDQELEARKAFFDKIERSGASVLSISALVVQTDSLPIEVHGRDVSVSRKPDSLALIVHTSGTTSNAKGVIATDRMEVASARALREYWCISPKDISVCALPLSYTFGLFTASYVPLSAGATVLLLQKFNPVKVLEEIEIHGATMMVGVPTMFAMMVNVVRDSAKSFNTSSMRLFAASGASVLEQTRSDFRDHLHHDLLDYYALSECTPIFSFDLRREDLGMNWSGRLVDGASVRIVDDEGNDVKPGNVGSLLVSSERLTPGYYRDLGRTEQAIKDGWFATGDLVQEREDGYYAIVGRTRDQIISGGHKIAAVEIENTLLQHPKVSIAAVKGVPDALLGEKVVAFIVLDEGAQLNEADLLEFCKTRIASYKLPKKIEFRSSLPLSPAGKVLKRELN